MRRKVIQIANSTQLVSLPRKWCLKYDLKKGDEVEVEERGNRVVISKEKEGLHESKIELNITGLDRTSIMYYIRSAYRSGYDEVLLKFNNPTTLHCRTNKKVNVISVLHQEVNRLVSFEIVQQRENFCVIKDITSPVNPKDFDTVLRRIFLLLTDACKDLTNGLITTNRVLVESIEEKHDSITKFVSYCLRHLNKFGHQDPQSIPLLYHLIANLDNVTDVLKYCARFMLETKVKISALGISVLKRINRALTYFYEIYYSFSLEKVVYFQEERDSVKKTIKHFSCPAQSPQEIILINDFASILELLYDCIEAKMSLEYISLK